MERFDVLYPHEYTDREGNKRTSWWRVGGGFTTQKGDVVLELPVMPVPTGGPVKLIIRPARPKSVMDGSDEGVRF